MIKALAVIASSIIAVGTAGAAVRSVKIEYSGYAEAPAPLSGVSPSQLFATYITASATANVDPTGGATQLRFGPSPLSGFLLFGATGSEIYVLDPYPTFAANVTYPAIDFATASPGVLVDRATSGLFTQYLTRDLTAQYRTSVAFRLTGYDTIVTDPTASFSVTQGAAVPEPATWGMMVLGFGLMGTLARRTRSVRADA